MSAADGRIDPLDLQFLMLVLERIEEFYDLYGKFPNPTQLRAMILKPS